jgi:hypothetical protein
MDRNSQRLVGLPGLWQLQYGLTSRTAALICLLAFLLSLATPIVHMWEVAAERQAAAFKVLSTLSLGQTTGCSVALMDTGEAARSGLHDAALCPVCKGLARVREWLVTRVTAVDAPRAQNWYHPAAVGYAPPIILHALAPRAPPYTS